MQKLLLFLITTSMFIPLSLADSWKVSFTQRGLPLNTIHLDVVTIDQFLYVDIDLRHALPEPLFGGAFQLQFDPVLLEYERFVPGDVFEMGDTDPIYMVGGDDQHPGRLTVGMTLKRGDELPQEIGTLLTLIFRIKKPGETALAFEEGVLKTLTKYEELPEVIPDITWPEGTLKIESTTTKTSRTLGSALPRSGFSMLMFVGLSLVPAAIVWLMRRKGLNRN